MTAAASDGWKERARSVPIEDELARRGFHMSGKIERAGPCPVCGGDDRFSINTKKQVWNCRGCGKGGDVIDLVQHIDGVDFTAAATTLAGERPQAKPNGKASGKDKQTGELTRVVAGKWRYEDEAGELLFGVKRVEYRNPDGTFVLNADDKHNKDFIPGRVDPRSGKWIWRLIIDGVPAVRIVPYRLPELIEAIGNGHPIVIAEGEGKVDLLRSWGVPATCNAGGKKQWKAEHSAFLRGADVVILPDNDDAGREHCDVVGASLQGIAASVSVLELPNLPSKGDIIDWAKAGGTAEQLHHLIAHEAKPWEGVGAEAGAEHADNADDTVDLGERDAGDDVDPPAPRGWLLANQFCRKFLSGLVAPGSTGKTALRMLQALSLVVGRALTGQHVFRRCRVLLVSFEDDSEELKRRILAARLHHNIALDDVKGWLFYATPKGIKLAEMRNGSRHIGMLEKSLRRSIERRRPDLVILDPYVKLHALEENDNGAMDFVCDLLATLAIEYDIAIDAPHHTKKGQIAPGDADSGRGASAMRDAGRLMHTLTTMDEAEAKAFSIDPELRHAYVRLDKGKVNLVPPTRTATWFKLVNVRLGNGNEDYPNGDEVQTVEPWSPPKTWEGLSSVTLNIALTDIDNGLPNGQRYTAASAATDRAAWKVVQKHCPDRSEAQCREIIKTWVGNGVLDEKNYDDPVERKPRKGLKLDPTKRPS